MLDPKRIWRVVVPILLIVLVLAMTSGMAWHHHDRNTADKCVLCHLAIAPAPLGASECGLAIALAEFEIQDVFFVSRNMADEKPPRAPPA